MVCGKHNKKYVELDNGDTVCPFCFWEFLLKTMPAEELCRLVEWSQERYYETGEINEDCILKLLLQEAREQEKTLEETVMDLVERQTFFSLLPPVFYQYPLFRGFY